MGSSETAATPPVAAQGAGTREALLDAVGDLLADRSWGQVGMAAVGEHAGLSRQTVYNLFGSRAGLAQAYVIREAGRFLEAAEGAIRSNPERPARALSAALEIFLAAAETHPLVRAIAAAESGDELLALVTTRGGPVLDLVTGRLRELILATWPHARPERAELAADTLVRLAISHAALPGGPPAETAERVAAVLEPFIAAELTIPTGA